ncbi:hypothetical protein BDW74DRAFT_8460 [Aspergillus multicolor]|uniref:uncharacterized protein n=1 Tax=Aspergillus multicolor TaxID=41759 RepID=UPI003CCCDC63
MVMAQVVPKFLSRIVCKVWMLWTMENTSMERDLVLDPVLTPIVHLVALTAIFVGAYVRT